MDKESETSKEESLGELFAEHRAAWLELAAKLHAQRERSRDEDASAESAEACENWTILADYITYGQGNPMPARLGEFLASNEVARAVQAAMEEAESHREAWAALANAIARRRGGGRERPD